MNIKYLESIQNSNGDFGSFHSMSSNSSITTEKALRRFLFLGLDINYPIVKRCLDYVKRCLYKEIYIPDRREKVINWDVFEELMFSSWLNIFNVKDEKLTSTKMQWKRVIENSVVDNKFNYDEYKKQYRSTFGSLGKREISPSNFYMVTLLKGVLTPDISNTYFKYIMEKGIYYIYDKNLYEVPACFDSFKTINYLIAIKLIASFAESSDDLNFIKNWLYKNMSSEGKWIMMKVKPDGVIFPRSENWRKKENKLADINFFINEIISDVWE